MREQNLPPGLVEYKYPQANNFSSYTNKDKYP